MRGITWLLQVFLSSRAGSGKRWQVAQCCLASASARLRSTGGASAWPSAGASSRGRPARHISSKKERINNTPLSPLGQARSKREKRTSALFRDDCLFFKFSTRKRLPFWITVWPSASSFPRMASMPPGYFGMICPSLLSVRHYGVMRLRPCCANSTAAYAAIQEKMPVLIGQVKSVFCFFASAVRSSLMEVSLPFGTFFISASTSSGAGITKPPSPSFVKSLGSRSLVFQLMLSP